MEKVNIFWFRRDLRVDDNHGLFQALKAGLPVVPVFIFDPSILTRFPDPNDARLTFIHLCLADLNHEFQKQGSSLQVYFSSPAVVFGQLSAKYAIQDVYANTDYEPAAVERDQQVEKLLNKSGVGFHAFKDQVIFHHHEVVKANGAPYTVFTPYSKQWKEELLRSESLVNTEQDTEQN